MHGFQSFKSSKYKGQIYVIVLYQRKKLKEVAVETCEVVIAAAEVCEVVTAAAEACETHQQIYIYGSH